MALALREEDLEAGLGDGESSGNLAFGGSSFSGKYMGRFHQETVDEARPLLQTNMENQEEHEHLINLRMKCVKDKHKKVNTKRPPKPPRPPNGPSLDAADMKLIRELSELALEKRMRIERMKDLKKLRASKAAASSSNTPNSTSVALIVTVLFCLIILFQGMYSRSGSVISLQRSPGPILSPNTEDLISIQVFKDLSPDADENGHNSGTEQSSTAAMKEELTKETG